MTGFPGKLDFLMSLTGTTNSALARTLSFDASYVCRIRNGKRGLPVGQPFVEPAAAYLAKRIRETYQVQAACQAIGWTGAWPDDPAQAAPLLARWLKGNDDVVIERFEGMLASLSTSADATAPKVRTNAEAHLACGDATLPTPMRYGLGNEGRRAAVGTFLSKLVAMGEPCQILLYSDECMDWLTENPAFLTLWASLLARLLAGGSTISVVHTLTRDVGEMISAVQNWLPLYLTGRVQSYYLPNLRDRVCRRSIFVAVGKAAVSASSIGETTSNTACLLSFEHDVVGACEHELRDLVGLCRPLTKALRLDDAKIGVALDRFWADGRPRIACNGDVGDVAAAIEDTLLQAVPQVPHPPFDTANSLGSARLPEGVAALLNDDGFVLFHLKRPKAAIFVSERLLTAAFAQFVTRTTQGHLPTVAS